MSPELLEQATTDVNATAQIVLAVGTAVASVLTAFGTLLVYLLSRKIHTLTNSAMGAALLSGKLAARGRSDLSRTPADLALAEEADRMYAEHQRKQAIVDRRGM